jgi:hypothetical protein
MSKINWPQIASLIRSLVPFIGGLLVMRGIVSATQFDTLINQAGKVVTDVTVLAGLLAPIVTAVWGMLTHTDAAVVKAAAAVPDVQKIIVTPPASSPLAAVVLDPSIPKVTTS